MNELVEASGLEMLGRLSKNHRDDARTLIISVVNEGSLPDLTVGTFTQPVLVIAPLGSSYVFLTAGSTCSNHQSLHGCKDVRTSIETMSCQFFLPYFTTAALRMLSSVFFDNLRLFSPLLVSTPSS